MQQNLDGEVVSNAWARFDDSRKYRFELGRMWDPKLPRCAFIMLNPSTATAEQDDPTIRRCIGFAKREGCGSLEVGNLFAFRATDPRELYKQADPVGPGNDGALVGMQKRAGLVVAAWGNHGTLHKRAAAVRDLLQPGGPVHCLGVTKEGQPPHPLYIAAETKLLLWQGQGGKP